MRKPSMHAVAVGLALPALILFAACESSEPATQPDLGVRVSVVRSESLSTIQHNFYSALRDPVRRVITDRSTWEQVWHLANGNATPPGPLPDMDFGTESVLLVAAGMKSTGGYGIQIDSVAVFESGQRIYVTSSSPGSQCITTQAITFPAHLVKVPRHLDTASFVEQARTTAC